LYNERLPHYSHMKGDTIEVYKIITGKYQTCVAPILNKESKYVTGAKDLRLVSC